VLIGASCHALVSLASPVGEGQAARDLRASVARMARRLALLLALLLPGCGPDGDLLRALGDTVLPDETPPVTREQAEALPYASAVVRLGARRPAFVVLHSARGR
jgi:hypothetical protein